jgi:LTXXQ motif family protein
MPKAFRMTLFVSASLFLGVAAMLAATMFAHAQPYGNRSSWSMGPGMMIGPGMMGRAGFERMCNGGAIGFAEWRIGRIEQELKLTDEQRSHFDELKTALLKASEAMRTACSSESPSTMVGQMQAMDKRLDAMSSAVKSIRPALEAFGTNRRTKSEARYRRGARPLLAMARIGICNALFDQRLSNTGAD